MDIGASAGSAVGKVASASTAAGGLGFGLVSGLIAGGMGGAGALIRRRGSVIGEEYDEEGKDEEAKKSLRTNDIIYTSCSREDSQQLSSFRRIRR
jgi:hypothetical protein